MITLYSLFKKSLDRFSITTLLDQDIYNIAVLINYSPQLMLLAVKSDEYFIDNRPTQHIELFLSEIGAACRFFEFSFAKHLIFHELT